MNNLLAFHSSEFIANNFLVKEKHFLFRNILEVCTYILGFQKGGMDVFLFSSNKFWLLIPESK